MNVVQDVTGFAASVNHFHVELFLGGVDVGADVGRGVVLVQGVKAALRLSERLAARGAYRVMVSLGDLFVASVSVRFWGLREGQSYCGDDPSVFAKEAVLMIDVGV